MPESLEHKIQRQLELEEESYELGIKRYRDQVQKSNISDLPPGIALLYRAIAPLSDAVRLFKQPQPGGARLGQTRRFFRLFEDDVIAYITAKTCLNAIGTPEPVQKVAIRLATALKDHLEYQKFQQENPGFLYAVEKNLKTSNARHRRAVIMRAKRLIGVEDETWTDIDRLHIGVKLIELFIATTGLVERAKMSVKRQKHSSDVIYILQGTQEAKKWIEHHNAKCELLSPFHLPMIISPRKWEGPYGGGFISNLATARVKLIKSRDMGGKALEDLEKHPMPFVYRALNAVQETPWRINKKVLEVLKAVWEQGGGVGDLPTQTEEPLPPSPWKNDEEYKRLQETSPEVIKSWKVAATRVYDRRVREVSKRFAVIQKLWIAEKFKDEEEIFFVWNMDWRGRIYPLQSFINPQADDSGKSLIEFAEGKPLGDRGLFWLKVHLANEFGVDKVSFEERVKWVDSNEHLILDSASNPLDGYDFWMEADNPFQFLAACFEYEGSKSGGMDYLSRIPIGLDGSCNGLQNFSAMLRDEIGGEATNLVPGEKPQDIYQRVADVLVKKVEQDVQAREELAGVWAGKIDRGITKRAVMTTPYGAKEYGLGDQLVAELEKRDKPNQKYLQIEDNFAPCKYLARKLYESIGEVVIAARQAMDWLQEIAKLTYFQPLSWTTPIGFKVIQAYRQQQHKRVQTFWGSIRIQLSLLQDHPNINKKKQVNGISPNFVHSMDASHLMMTVNMCLEEGISAFSMVHDSYATHACNTDALSVLLRKAFIKQYSDDVLLKFKQEVEQQIPEELRELIPEVPKKGNLNLNEVQNSKYFFA